MKYSFRMVMRATIGLLAGSVIAFMIGYAGLVAAGYKPVAVYSGSMTPTIGVGGLAVDRPIPARDVHVGDVITFSDPYVKGRLVTHRIVNILQTPSGAPAYRTKGDANPSRDPWTIRLTGQVGRVAFDIPFAGYVLVYAHTREVRGALILIVAFFVLSSLLRRIWRQEKTAPAGA